MKKKVMLFEEERGAEETSMREEVEWDTKTRKDEVLEETIYTQNQGGYVS